MKQIIDWFDTQDYDEGVQLYASLPSANLRVVNSLKKGKSDRNLALLIRELRLHRNKGKSTSKPEPVSPPANRKKNKVTSQPVPADSSASKPKVTAENQKAREESANAYFQKIKYGELPPPLKVRFKEGKDVFYMMCDLKESLNELPEPAEKKALSLQLQIEALDEQRDQIWKELDHWKKHKTLLPSEASEDFSQLSPVELYKKKSNTASSISKMRKRIKAWQAKIDKETDKVILQRLAEQMNRTKKKLHQHELNLRNIEDLL